MLTEKSCLLLAETLMSRIFFLFLSPHFFSQVPRSSHVLGGQRGDPDTAWKMVKVGGHTTVVEVEVSEPQSEFQGLELQLKEGGEVWGLSLSVGGRRRHSQGSGGFSRLFKCINHHRKHKMQLSSCLISVYGKSIV